MKKETTTFLAFLVLVTGILGGNFVCSETDENPQFENNGFYVLLASFACIVVGGVVVILEDWGEK